MLGIVSCQNITEVSRRDDILNSGPGRDRLDVEVRKEIVYRLGEDPGPVDGVYRS